MKLCLFMTYQYTHFFNKKLRSSLSTESFLSFRFFSIVIRTKACCISVVIGKKVEFKILILSYKKNVCTLTISDLSLQRAEF